MNIRQAMKMALRSILGNKGRSILTMLGIIIGIASVMTIVSVVNGQNQQSLKQFEAMGINYLEVGTVQEAWGQEMQDAALKETQMQQALAQLLHPWDEHSSLTLVEYHATPQESEFFTESISSLRARVREYLSAARSGER